MHLPENKSHISFQKTADYRSLVCRRCRQSNHAKAASHEHHCLVVIRQHLLVDVAEDGAGEDDFFEVFAEADEVFDGLAVGDADDVLLDDRALVEVGRIIISLRNWGS